MRYIIIALLTTTAVHAQAYRPSQGMLIRQQRTRAVAAHMMRTLRQQRNGAHRDRARRKRRRRRIPQHVLDKIKKYKEEKRKRFLEKVRTQPDVPKEKDEYHWYKIKKKHNMLPEGDYARWKQSADYARYLKNKKRRDKGKEEQQKVSDKDKEKAHQRMGNLIMEIESRKRDSKGRRFADEEEEE